MGNFNCCQGSLGQPAHGTERTGDPPPAFTVAPAARPQRFVENWVEQPQGKLGARRPDAPVSPQRLRSPGFGDINLNALSFD